MADQSGKLELSRRPTLSGRPEMSGKLRTGTKLAYGVGDLGANLVLQAIGFYLMYYLTDVALLSASLAGLMLTLVRLVDAFTDPFIGYLSDRTRTKWGRRRPYILFGAFPVGVFFFLLFAGPVAHGQAGLFIQYLLLYTLYFLSFSVVNIPYSALTPDMTQDFDERTNLTGFRMASAVVGTLIAAGATRILVDLFGNERLGFATVAAAYGLIFILVNLIVFAGARERPNLAPVNAERVPVLQLYRRVFANSPFVLVAVAYVLGTIGTTIISASLAYYFKYYVGREALLSPIFLVLLLTAMAAIPLWTVVSKRIGKKPAYNTGMGILALAMILFFFLSPGQVGLMFAVAALAGLGLSTFYVLPWAMVPDTIEYNELRTGARNEGIFYGVWSFGTKLAGALAGSMLGLGLSLARYVPNVAEQTPGALLGIRAITCLAPLALIVAGIIVLGFYPITQAKYREMLAEIEARKREKQERVTSQTT